MNSSETTTRRRSRRLNNNSNNNTRPRLFVYHLRPPWIRHYTDIGHCRLQKCAQRIRDATSNQIRDLETSWKELSHDGNTNSRMGALVAMAIQAASAYGIGKDALLVEYAQAVLGRGMNPNDSYKGRTAISLAAYHGYLQLLQFLLDAGASIDETMLDSCNAEHAIRAAVRNGQHEATKIILRERLDEAKIICQRESSEDSRTMITTLGKAIQKQDLETVQLLRMQIRAQLSDQDYRLLFHDSHQGRRDRGHASVVLKAMYPEISIWNWCKALHWTFPNRDRRMLHWLWHTWVHSSSSSSAKTDPEILPEEIVLRVFSFVGRGWWIDVELH